MLEALLGLPILSFLALPIFSNWSTSLNLLFFWMTWSTLVLSHSQFNVELFGTLAIRAVTSLFPNIFFLAFDCLVPSVAVDIKSRGELALPRRYGGKRLSRIVAWSILNMIFATLVQVGVELLLVRLLQWRSALKVSTWTPTPWQVGIDLGKGLVMRGFLQYHIHRHMLHPNNSTTLSTLHQNWFHSIQTPFPFTSSYDHPLVYLIWKFLPLYIPALLFRFHILTFHVLLALVSLEETFTYSGYSVLPSSIILGGMARRTEAHMLSSGKGNFAPLGLMDWVHGTTVGKDVMDDVEDELDKRNAKEKAGNAIDKAGDMINGAGGNATKRKGSKK